MSRKSLRNRAASVVEALQGPTLLAVAPSCVPTKGFGGAYFLVPAHYHLTRDSLHDKHMRIATVLDVHGNEAFVPFSLQKLTPSARQILARVGLPAPRHEYEPGIVPKETWAAYERLVPEEWMRTASSPEMYAVRGAMPESFVGKVTTLLGDMEVPLVPRVATIPRPGCYEPMFRMALRDVVRVHTYGDFEKEFEDSEGFAEI